MPQKPDPAARRQAKTTVTLTGAEITALRVLIRIGGDDWDGICEANGINPDYDALAAKFDRAHCRIDDQK
jgi:hypothetical protein